MGQDFKHGCCIYPTAPFVSGQKLDEAYQQMMKHNFESVFPIMRFGYPIQRALKVDQYNKISMFYPEHQRSRSQDLEAAFHDAGQFYWFQTTSLRKNKKLLAPYSGFIEISEMEGQDIDTLQDWKLAELKYALLEEHDNQ